MSSPPSASRTDARRCSKPAVLARRLAVGTSQIHALSVPVRRLPAVIERPRRPRLQPAMTPTLPLSGYTTTSGSEHVEKNDDARRLVRVVSQLVRARLAAHEPGDVPRREHALALGRAQRRCARRRRAAIPPRRSASGTEHTLPRRELVERAAPERRAERLAEPLAAPSSTQVDQKPDPVGRRQRARRQPGARRAVVVLGRRDVVRPVRIEDGSRAAGSAGGRGRARTGRRRTCGSRAPRTARCTRAGRASSRSATA